VQVFDGLADLRSNHLVREVPSPGGVKQVAGVFWAQAKPALRSVNAAIASSQAASGGLFYEGTIEERKRVVRAFVESLTVAGTKRSGEIRLKNLPALEALTGAFSVRELSGGPLRSPKDESQGVLLAIPSGFRDPGDHTGFIESRPQAWQSAP